MTARPALELRGITKRFGAVTVLDDVGLDLRAGEVHAIVGENGAGKSTLMRIAGGVHRPDDGTMRYLGEPYAPRDAAGALRAGVAMVHQELSLAPDLSVAENVFAGKEPTRAGFVRVAEMHRRTAALAETMGLEVDTTRLVGTLSLSRRQIAELLKAAASEPRVLILDEPTSALESRETRRLLTVARGFADRGAAVAFVSHRLEEVFAVADRITVLRDGRRVVTWTTGETTREAVVAAMVGRQDAGQYPPRSASRGERLLHVEGLTRRGSYADVGLDVYGGEIVGFAGLVGAGRTEVMRGLVGADPVDAGEVWFLGRKGRFRDVADAGAAGLAYLPEDRRNHGLFLDRSVEDNIVCGSLKACSRRGVLRSATCRRLAADMAARLDIRARDLDQEARNLSGGNQQKVLLARRLATRPAVLIVDEPTRGVDVGAKAEIHRLLREHADQGAGIVVVSSDLEEVLGLSDRVVVMREGRVVCELDGATATPEAVIAPALGVVRGAS